VATAVLAAAVFGALALLFHDDSGDQAARRDRPGARHGLGGSATRPLPPRPRPTGPQGLLREAQAVEQVRRFTPWVLKGSRRGRLIALTFDDGPGPITPALLADLRRLHAPATFFQVGSQARANPDLARAESDKPFAFGSHTESHARLSTLGPAAQRAEIAGGAGAVDQATGHEPRLFRPPYGAYDDATLRVLRRERRLMVLWTFSAYDWKHPDADYITRRVLRLARPGAIVLMHDAGGVTRVPTLQAVPRIVLGLRRRGYRLVTVPRLLRDAPPVRRPERPPSPYPG
jgi:peptidoglycan-N-acetylglucosamine deacetylase